MIAAALLIGAQALRPVVLEYPDPAQGVVSIQCAIRLPELNVTEASLVSLLPTLLSSGSATYPGVLFRNYAARGGAPFRVTARPDCLRVEIQTLPQDLEIGLDLLTSLLRQPEIDREALQRALDAAPVQPREWFLASITPIRPEWEGARVDHVLQVFRRVVRPENVTIAVGGSFAPGSATEGVASRLDGWRVPAARPLVQRHEERGELRRRSGPTTISLFSPPARHAIAGIGQEMVTVAALGSGRNGAMTRIVREEMRLSYRQHALLVPTPGGLQPVLTFATIPKEELEFGGRVRTALLADIDSWNTRTLEAARRYTSSSLTGQAEWGPLFLTSHGSPGPSLADQTYLRAWWHMTFGESLDLGTLAASMDAVDLQSAQRRAREIVESATVQVILGPRRVELR